MIVTKNQSNKTWRRHHPICPELRNLRKSGTDLAPRSRHFSRTEGTVSSPPCLACRRQRSITLAEIWYLRLAALTDNRPDSTAWTICCLNPVSNFRGCFPIDRLLLAGPSYPLVEPIAPPSNSQLFSPVNAAQSIPLLVAFFICVSRSLLDTEGASRILSCPRLDIPKE